MTYDAWKTRSPDDDRYDYEDEETAECDHGDYEEDILTGRAWCPSCGHRWWLTNQEITAAADRQRYHDEMMRRIEFRERWLWWWDDIKHRVELWRLKRKRPARDEVDDEIPF